ncbi:MAG: hypothetical protein AAF335_01560, partial [Bacteroidota bacterium]
MYIPTFRSIFTTILLSFSFASAPASASDLQDSFSSSFRSLDSNLLWANLPLSPSLCSAWLWANTFCSIRELKENYGVAYPKVDIHDEKSWDDFFIKLERELDPLCDVEELSHTYKKNQWHQLYDEKENKLACEDADSKIKQKINQLLAKKEKFYLLTKVLVAIPKLCKAGKKSLDLSLERRPRLNRLIKNLTTYYQGCQLNNYLGLIKWLEKDTFEISFNDYYLEDLVGNIQYGLKATLQREVPKPGSYEENLKVSPHDDYIAWEYRKTVSIWNLESDQIKISKETTNFIRNLCWSGDNLAFICYNENFVHIWSPESTPIEFHLCDQA